GAVVVCRRTGAANWQTFVAACFALVGAAALWLTHSRGAMVGLLAATVGCAILVWGRRLRTHWIAALAGTLLLAGLVYGGLRGGLLTTDTGKSSTPITQRLEYWRTTWEMIRERPWLGVGPGNFRANYGRLMPESADEKIKDPHNFALEIWATCGVFALLALLAAFAAFFYQMVRSLSGGRQPPETYEPRGADAPRSEDTHPLRWEYYLGGMFGLLLGFVLRATATESPGAILEETWSALLRSVVWFAAFGLFERIVWSARGRVLALTTGIAALLVNLCVSGGISFPSVAGPLWVAVALALNAASLKPVAWLSRPGAAMILPLPILLGVVLAYGVYILYPVLSAYSLAHEAALSIQALRNGAIRTNKVAFVRKSVIGRLEEAARLTPDDARLYVQLAWWHGVQWSQTQRDTASSDMSIANRALRYGQQAVVLDPHGGEGYWVQYVLRTRFFAALNEQVAAKGPNRDPLFIATCQQNARQQYEEAAKTLAKYLPDDPHEVSLRYALAQAWFKAGNKEKGREQAEAARRLDEAAVSPTRKLSDPQREQIQEWLSASPSD
ncbi:MAG TPA: O-antigen ligase family protein, partial [Gemmataceae bacterium]